MSIIPHHFHHFHYFHHSIHNNSTTTPVIRTPQHQVCHFDPLYNLFTKEGQYLTPQYAGVYSAQLYGQALGKAIPYSIVEEVTYILLCP